MGNPHTADMFSFERPLLVILCRYSANSEWLLSP